MPLDFQASNCTIALVILLFANSNWGMALSISNVLVGGVGLKSWTGSFSLALWM